MYFKPLRKIIIFIWLFSIGISFKLKAQTYNEQYEKCSKVLKDIPWEDTTYMYKVLERDECLIGAPAPDFTATTMKGQQIQLSKLKGQVIVLNFWSTGCGPCIEEMPQLNKLVKQYSGKNVVFLSFTPNNKNTLKGFFVKHPFNFTTIPESNLGIDVFKLPGVVPYTIVIDRLGKISKMWFGGRGDDTFTWYKEAIEKALSN